MVLDMTTGSPLKRILKFFVPVLLSNLFQQLYSTVDSIIVSHYLGVEAFAGVSSTGSLTFLILGLAFGTCSGFAIPVSQRFGAGDVSTMRRYFANALIVSGVIAVVLGFGTGIFSPQILRLTSTPDDIFPYALSYIQIILFGIPATMLYNLLSSVMRAVGDGRTPLIMLIISSILNVALDILFIVTFKMGIAGAAYATVLSQLVSGILCIYVIWRSDVLRIRRSEWGLSSKIIRHLLGVGLPMGLQFSITAVGSTMLQAAVNSLGSSAVAAIGAGSKAQFIFTTPLEAIGVTMATYCGQNLGARRIDRVRTGVKQTAIIMFLYSIVAFVLQFLFGRYIVMLFVGSATQQVLDWAALYMNIVHAMVPLLMIVLVYRNSVQGLGYSRAAMFAGVMELIGRAVVATVLVKIWGFTGACLAHPAAWLCADVFLLPLYFHVVRKLEKQPDMQKAA